MKLAVHYEPTDIVDKRSDQRRANLRNESGPVFSTRDEPPPIYRAPHHLIVRAIIRVPSQFLYSKDLRRQLNFAIYGSDFFDKRDEPMIDFQEPAQDKILNQYIYSVNYRFTKEQRCVDNF